MSTKCKLERGPLARRQHEVERAETLTPFRWPMRLFCLIVKLLFHPVSEII